jgi:murein DD-endopeptidase MepM/ murein hydrolase activator NlpD
VQDDAQIISLLNSITHKLRAQQSLLAVAQQTLDAVNLRISSVQRRLGELDVQRRKRAKVIAARARALYIMGPVDGSQALASAQSVSDFYGRAGTLEFVAGYDRRVLEDLANIRNESELARAQLRTEQRQAAAARDDVAQEVAVVNEAAQVQQSAHDRLSQRISGYRSEVAALARDEARIKSIISSRSSYGTISGPSGRHGFAWPTISHHINSYYGPRWGGFHTGIDIQCPEGGPIAASKAGKVIAAEWGGGYGEMTIIDHGGGYSTLYAHQSRIYVHQGQYVSQHQRIGACGATGNATGPHLHFEIRINGQHVNPLPYLP